MTLGEKRVVFWDICHKQAKKKKKKKKNPNKQINPHQTV